jgi:hypothetical protein
VSTTGRELTRRLQLLLALGATTTLVLYAAYRGVHDDAVPLSSASAPGVLAVDTAKSALGKAKTAIPDAQLADAGTGDFQTQISVANQSLALAASENVTGLTGRQVLQTVTGLIAVYSGWIEQANREPAESPLRPVYLHYAERALNAPGTSEDIMGRLDGLRALQLRVAAQQVSFSPPLRAGWGAVLVLSLALCGALVEAQRYARRRFRRLVNPPLLAATLLWATGVTTLGWLTLRTHSAMAASYTDLRKQPGREHVISQVGAAVADRMAQSGFRAALSVWILVAGVLLLGLIVAGLLPRIFEYRFRGPR